MKKAQRIKDLKKLIADWDRLAKSNTKNNIHNLSTSKRQDLIDELISLTKNSE